MPAHNVSHVFIELGLVVVGLAVLARLANRWGFSAIPLYLLAGLAFGRGGLAPLELTENFIHIGGGQTGRFHPFLPGGGDNRGGVWAKFRLGVPGRVVGVCVNF